MLFYYVNYLSFRLEDWDVHINVHCYYDNTCKKRVLFVTDFFLSWAKMLWLILISINRDFVLVCGILDGVKQLRHVVAAINRKSDPLYFKLHKP